jgi:hypothetical protein
MATKLKIKSNNKERRTTATGPDGTVLASVTSVWKKGTVLETPVGTFFLLPEAAGGLVADDSNAHVATVTRTHNVLFPDATEVLLPTGERFQCGAKNKVLRAGTWQAVPEQTPHEVWASSRHGGFGKILFTVEDALLAHPQHDLLVALFVHLGVDHVVAQIQRNQ